MSEPPPFAIPARIECADIIRDGGSYCLVYLDTTGERHEIDLPVRLDRKKFEPIGYSVPSILSRSSGERRSLTWEQAEALSTLLVRVDITSGPMCDPHSLRECLLLLTLGGALPGAEKEPPTRDGGEC